MYHPPPGHELLNLAFTGGAAPPATHYGAAHPGAAHPPAPPVQLSPELYNEGVREHAYALGIDPDVGMARARSAPASTRHGSVRAAAALPWSIPVAVAPRRFSDGQRTRGR